MAKEVPWDIELVFPGNWRFEIINDLATEKAAKEIANRIIQNHCTSQVKAIVRRDKEPHTLYQATILPMISDVEVDRQRRRDR